MNELRAAGREIVNLGIGEPKFPVAPHILEAAERAVRNGPHGYSEAAGHLTLREAVAAHHEKQGHDVHPEDVFIVPGAKVGLLFAALAFGEPGVEILYPDPGFPIYGSTIALSGASPVPYPLRADRGFALDPDAVLERVTERTRLILLNSPGNPTGGVYSRDEIAALCAGLERHPHVALASDEIYRPLYFTDEPPASLLSFPEIRSRLLLIDGWSKAYAMTGWRLGYCIWPAEFREIALRLAVNNHSCVNNAVQAAGRAALEGPQDSVVAMRNELRGRRTRLRAAFDGLAGISCPEPLGAFYAFPKVSLAGRTADEVQEELLERAGVAALAGRGFGACGAEHIRFSFAASEEELTEAAARIAAYWAEKI